MTSMPDISNNFNNSDTSPFCKKYHKASEIWEVLLNKAELQANKLIIPMLNASTKQPLNMTISCLDNDELRVRFDPLDFEHFDTSTLDSVINQELISRTKQLKTIENDQEMYIEVGDYTVEVRKKPFSMTIQKAKETILQINLDNGFVFADDGNAMTFTFPTNTVFHGLPLHRQPLNLPQTTPQAIRFFNTDINHIQVKPPMSLYGAIPLVIGRSPNHSTSLFWLNPTETYVDIANEQIRFISEGGFVDFFVFSGAIKDIPKKQMELTGKPPIPPITALGYHQSRWGYMSSKEVREIAKKLDEAGIPFDSIWLDLDHTDGCRYFTFCKDFADMDTLLDEFAEKHRFMVTLVDPHIKKDPEYYVYKQASEQNLLVKDKDGKDYVAWCWPGEAVWADYLNPATQEWWASLYSFENYKKSRPNLFIWNDMNEPSVFEVFDRTMPKDNLHYGGVKHKEIHNMYGHLMVKSTRMGLLKRSEERPLILTRSYFAGTQKYAFVWTGDNGSSREMMKEAVEMVLTLGLCGQPYSGADVGGFFGSPDDSLLARWFQVGAYVFPFFRSHCHKNEAHREPYLMAEPFQTRAREAIQERYRLMPFIYTLASKQDIIARPTWYEFDGDDSEGVMLGRELLVVPIYGEYGETYSFVLPDETWFGFRTLERIKEREVVWASDKIPLYRRAGSIIPMATESGSSVMDTMAKPLELVVCVDEAQRAKGELYIDDGRTFAFQKGEFVRSLIEFDGKRMKASGKGPFEVSIERIRIAGLKEMPAKAEMNGKEVEMVEEDGVLRLEKLGINASDEWEITFQ